MNPWVSPFSTARPTRDIGRVAINAFRAVLRAADSFIPARPNGGSV
jgi:hypothetical protein